MKLERRQWNQDMVRGEVVGTEPLMSQKVCRLWTLLSKFSEILGGVKKVQFLCLTDKTAEMLEGLNDISPRLREWLIEYSWCL